RNALCCSRARTLPVLALRTIKNESGPKKSGTGHWEVPPDDPRFGGTGDAILDPLSKKRPPGPKTPEEFADVANQKNWVSYGWDFVDYKEDRQMIHILSFLVVTVITVFGIYLGVHYPDYARQTEWAQREAYLELHRREKLGLPLIGKDYVDPSKVILPTEEQLGNFEVYY
ncbi:NADH dehydrogenase [ubiquinone] 1 beta subcomplex subunit 11-like protein, partial [Dinothrombium tinctorium]